MVDPDSALAPAGPIAADLRFAEGGGVRRAPLRTEDAAVCDDRRPPGDVNRLRIALKHTKERNRLLVPLGTPIDADPIEALPSERVWVQETVIGDPFSHTKHYAGTHIHVEQRTVADQLNVLNVLDPALALCNTLPYCWGRRVAASARACCYRGRSYADLPDHGRLCPYVDTVGEWERRLKERYAELVERAVERGIDRERVESEFSPFDAVWTPVRPRREIPTTEWHALDATLPSELLRLVEGIGEVLEGVHTSVVGIEGEKGAPTEDELVLPTFDALSEYVERASARAWRRRSSPTIWSRGGFRLGSTTR